MAIKYKIFWKNEDPKNCRDLGGKCDCFADCEGGFSEKEFNEIDELEDFAKDRVGLILHEIEEENNCAMAPIETAFTIEIRAIREERNNNKNGTS